METKAKFEYIRILDSNYQRSEILVDSNKNRFFSAGVSESSS